MATVSTIPIVDFSGWTQSSDKESRIKVAKQIVEASKEVGFVYIANHALPDSVLGEAFEWSRRFFALSPEHKLKAPHPEGWAVHRGYSWPGLEKVSQAISEGNDEELVKKLREVTDFKVRTHPEIECCGSQLIN
jgi:isopenicillin N synthase-like dioxygenase